MWVTDFNMQGVAGPLGNTLADISLNLGFNINFKPSD